MSTVTDNTENERDYSIARHREQLLKTGRKYTASLREQVTAKAWKRRDQKEFVRCMECGRLYRGLHRHVPAYHDMTIEEYSNRWHNPPLIAQLTKDKLSKKHAGKPRLYLRGKRSLGENARREGLATQPVRETLMDSTPMNDPTLVEHKLRGESIQEICAEVGLTHVAIVKRLKYLGFPPGRACLFLHGEPITRKHFADLCTDFDIGPKEIMAVIGEHPAYEVSKRVESRNTGWRRGTPGKAPASYYDCLMNQLKGRQSDSVLLARYANIVLDARARLTEKFCLDYYGGKKRIRSFRESEVRDLRALVRVLRKPLSDLRTWLQEQKGSPEPHEVLNWVCDQSRLEVTQKTGQGFRKLMFLWPALKALLSRKGAAWISRQQKINEALYELLAGDYDAAAHAIRQVALGRVTVAPAQPSGQAIRAEIAALRGRTTNRLGAVPANKREQQGKRGRPREENVREMSFFKVGAAVEKEIPPRMTNDRPSIVGARRLIANRTHFNVDVVAQYHKRFRQLQHQSQR